PRIGMLRTISTRKPIASSTTLTISHTTRVTHLPTVTTTKVTTFTSTQVIQHSHLLQHRHHQLQSCSSQTFCNWFTQVSMGFSTCSSTQSWTSLHTRPMVTTPLARETAPRQAAIQATQQQGQTQAVADNAGQLAENGRRHQYADAPQQRPRAHAQAAG